MAADAYVFGHVRARPWHTCTVGLAAVPDQARELEVAWGYFGSSLPWQYIRRGPAIEQGVARRHPLHITSPDLERVKHSCSLVRF